MVIYKTTNLVNGKFYIGKDAKNTKSYFGSGKVLKQAIKKYGRENFKKETLEVCTDLKNLEEREIYWIDTSNALEVGYNLTEGGTGGDTSKSRVYSPLSDSYKKKISETLRGNTPWNKGITGYMGANKSSYKPGKDHILYGTKQKQETVDKRVETLKLNGTYENTAKRQMKKVINEDDGKIFDSILSAAKHYNLTKSQVGSSCRNKTKKYSFKFV